MGKYKHGKQTETMSFADFDEKLRKAKLQLKHRSFLAFLFLSGARVSEILGLTKQDFKIESNVLVIHIPSKKRGTRLFLEFELDWPYVKEYIINHIEKIRGKERRVWSFTSRTAQRLVDKVFGEQYYPHFFRLNAAVEFCRNPKTSFQDLKAWFGWKRIDSINPYMGLARRDVASARQKRGLQFTK